MTQQPEPRRDEPDYRRLPERVPVDHLVETHDVEVVHLPNDDELELQLGRATERY